MRRNGGQAGEQMRIRRKGIEERSSRIGMGVGVGLREKLPAGQCGVEKQEKKVAQGKRARVSHLRVGARSVLQQTLARLTCIFVAAINPVRRRWITRASMSV